MDPEAGSNQLADENLLRRFRIQEGNGGMYMYMYLTVTLAVLQGFGTLQSCGMIL